MKTKYYLIALFLIIDISLQAQWHKGDTCLNYSYFFNNGKWNSAKQCLENKFNKYPRIRFDSKPLYLYGKVCYELYMTEEGIKEKDTLIYLSIKSHLESIYYFDSRNEFKDSLIHSINNDSIFILRILSFDLKWAENNGMPFEDFFNDVDIYYRQFSEVTYIPENEKSRILLLLSTCQKFKKSDGNFNSNMKDH